MKPALWKLAAASVVGSSHLRLDQPCQDASDFRIIESPAGEPVLVAVVCDGAGSAARAEIGARLACTRALDTISELIAGGGDLSQIDRAFGERWLEGFRAEVSRAAAAEGLLARDFACTVLAAAVGLDRAVFLQLGDGAIVVKDPDGDGYSWVFWPLTGEYANTTFFVTDPDAARHLEWAWVERTIDEVALFSDGLQHLVLHYESRTAHDPFFRPLFTRLRQSDDPALENISEHLAAFLTSPQVEARTDDDKTLILATRVLGETPPAPSSDEAADAVR